MQLPTMFFPRCPLCCRGAQIGVSAGRRSGGVRRRGWLPDHIVEIGND